MKFLAIDIVSEDHQSMEQIARNYISQYLALEFQFLVWEAKIHFDHQETGVTTFPGTNLYAFQIPCYRLHS